MYAFSNLFRQKYENGRLGNCEDIQFCESFQTMKHKNISETRYCNNSGTQYLDSTCKKSVQFQRVKSTTVTIE